MWRIQNVAEAEVTLDFSSAGLGQLRTSAVIADSVTITGSSPRAARTS